MTTQSAALAWLQQRIQEDETLDARVFDELRARQSREGLVHDGRPICSTLQPLILIRARYDRIARGAKIIAEAFERLVEAALKDDSLMAELGLTKAEEELARIDPGYPHLCVTSRLDAFLTMDGFKFLEYNAESPAGIADQDLLENIIFTLPHMQEFLLRFPHFLPDARRHLLDALREAYRAWGGTHERPNIAIVDWRGVATESEFKLLQTYFEAHGFPTVIADPHDLLFDGTHLTTGDGFRIDILYKRVIIHEFLARFDLTHPLVEAYAARRVLMANSFRVKIAHKKAGFAILSNDAYAHLFTDEQLAAIAAHIPWTRRLRHGEVSFGSGRRELVEMVRERREEFVIKPNDDYGGHGVVVGSDATDTDWNRAIDDALTQDYVVQERVAVEKLRFPVFTNEIEWTEMLVDFDPFLFHNEVEGGIVRLSASGLCNVSSGGGVTALLVLEESLDA